VTSTDRLPAVLGGPQAFPEGLPLVRPTIPDIPGLTARIQAILESGMLTNGKTVAELEERVAELLQVPHVVALSSCTAGLMLVLQAMDARGPVVMPSFTFAASAHAVHWAGGTPAWAEIRREDLTLDPVDAAEQVAATGAVAMTATHIYGTPCQVETLQKIADGAGIPLVYDAAHALGSRRRGRPVGGFGAAEVFSMSPTKVTTAGEGGLVATSDADLAARLRLGRDYGNPGDYDCRFPGLNARMSEIHAAIALAGITSVAERVAYRNELVQAFRSEVQYVPGLTFPSLEDGDVSTYKDLTLILEPEVFGLTNLELGAALKAEGIDSRRYYAPPIHRQTAYAALSGTRELPVTDEMAGRVLTPPLYSHMTVEQCRSVALTVVSIQRRACVVRAVLT
jgi:dTDP-4-amino-4,6-dideoxygalactose transaminase